MDPDTAMATGLVVVEGLANSERGFSLGDVGEIVMLRRASGEILERHWLAAGLCCCAGSYIYSD